MTNKLVVEAHNVAELLTIRDRRSHRTFLIDTGAQVSILPPSRADRVSCSLSKTNKRLVAANGSPIMTYGQKELTIDLGNNGTFTWTFILANVSRPILGADMLRHYGLLVDLKHRRLVSSSTFRSFEATTDRPRPAERISLVETQSRFSKLMTSRPMLITPTFSLSTKCKVRHRVETRGHPVHSKARRLAPDKLKSAKREFEELERLGIVRRSNSQWSSPLHIVKKKDGGLRPCGDYRRLNERTIADRYTLPNIQDCTAQLAGKCVFSKVDLVKGYHQVPMHPNDIAKTAIATPFGLYEYLRMPFGLKNATQTFQRLMDEVTSGLDNVYVYLDDVLVFSENHDQHERDLKNLFDRLEQYGLVVNPAKCVLGVSRLNFLGYEIDSKGAQPPRDSVEAIEQFPQPSDVGGLMRFNGMLNFYHRFVPGIAKIMKPLYEATAGKKSRSTKLIWSSTLLSAFRRAKAALADACKLIHPQAGAPTALTTDASNSALGAVLEQFVGGLWRPIAFFSRKLKPAETRYSAYDRELLGIHAGSSLSIPIINR